MEIHDPSRYGQAQARPLADVFRREERLEDVAHPIGGNTVSVVTNHDLDRSPIRVAGSEGQDNVIRRAGSDYSPASCMGWDLESMVRRRCS